MIGRLRGIVLEKQPPYLTLDVAGVGYELYAPMSTFYVLPESPDHVVSLYIHLVAREDDLSLYGFHTQEERRCFRALIKVNGVGPKLALAILSGIEMDQFLRYITEKNANALTKIPGVGKKTADRLVIDLYDKTQKWPRASTESAATRALPSQANDDALEALIALGYKSNEAKRMLERVADTALSSEALIRAALKTRTLA